MATPRLEPDHQVEQAPRTVIQTWRTDGYEIALEDTGDRTADIMGTPNWENAQVFGRISYDTARARHIIEWNRTGTLALEQYKRDHWDTKFYYAMAEYLR